MERKLVKSAIYGFILGLSIMLLFVTDIDKVVSHGSGSYTTYYLGTKDYIIKLIRYSIVFTYMIVIVTLLFELWLKLKNRNNSKE